MYTSSLINSLAAAFNLLSYFSFVFLFDALRTLRSSVANLLSSNSSALSFDTTAKSGILEIDTTNGSEKVNFGAGVQISGNISTPSSSDWDLMDDYATALSFDCVGKPGMLVFDTTDAAEKLLSSVGLELGACLSWTLGGQICSDGTDVTLTDGAANSITVNESYKSYTSRAKYDSTIGVILFDQSALDIVV